MEDRGEPEFKTGDLVRVFEDNEREGLSEGDEGQIIRGSEAPELFASDEERLSEDPDDTGIKYNKGGGIFNAPAGWQYLVRFEGLDPTWVYGEYLELA